MTAAHLHLLRGDDQYSIKLQITRIQEGLGVDFDPAMNLTHLDGRAASVEEMRTAVSTLPFFGSSRLVMINFGNVKLDKGRQDSLSPLLASVPPTTHLVLIVEDHQKWRRDQGSWVQVWETFNASHWLVKWFSSNPAAEIIDTGLPDTRQMPSWIIQETKRQGGKVDNAAANELSLHTGNDTSIASQEIAKLLMYVDFKRTVTQEDVLELVSEAGSADVFEMLDRMMAGREKEAQVMMRRLLDDSQPEIILGAVVHRFRQLLLVSEVLDNDELPAEAAHKLGILPRKMDEFVAAARRYGPQKLEQIYHHLLEIDLQSKTSQVDLASSLELLIIEAGEQTSITPIF